MSNEGAEPCDEELLPRNVRVPLMAPVAAVGAGKTLSHIYLFVACFGIQSCVLYIYICMYIVRIKAHIEMKGGYQTAITTAIVTPKRPPSGWSRWRIDSSLSSIKFDMTGMEQRHANPDLHGNAKTQNIAQTTSFRERQNSVGLLQLQLSEQAASQYRSVEM